MRLNLIFFALIIVSNARQVPRQENGRRLHGRANKRHRHHNMWTADSDCSKSVTSTTTSTTATPTTKDSYAGCEGCMNDELSVGDTSAGYCFPDTSGEKCICLCGDLFCQDGQIIDRTTCVSGGKLQDCRCIDLTSTTTSTSPIPTIGFH